MYLDADANDFRDLSENDQIFYSPARSVAASVGISCCNLQGCTLLFLSKLAPLLFYPLGLSITLTVIGLILLRFGRKKFSAGVIIGAVGLLFLSSLPVVDHVIVRSLEHPYDQATPVPPCSSIVLLCGAEVPELPPRSYPELNYAGDRLVHAARLYRQNKAPRVIVTGGKLPFITDFQGSAAHQAAYLLSHSLGVDSDAIIVEPQARNTYQHAGLVAGILDSLNLPLEIILVTSASHMTRSVGVFENAGFRVVPAPADFNAHERFQWGLLKFLPSAAALHRTTMAFHEYYGMVAYRILGWI